MNLLVHVVLAAALAFLIPLALIATRHELRKVRARIVEELRSTLFKDQRDLPQLRLVAAQYDEGTDGLGSKGDEEGRDTSQTRQSSLKLWTGALIYVVVCFVGFVGLLMPSRALLEHMQPAFFWTAIGSSQAMLGQAVTVAATAFLGGYVFQLRYLIRATINQELSALAFVRSCLHVVQGVIIAVVAYRALGAGAAGLDEGNPQWFGGAIGIAFLIGYWPDLGLMKIAKGLQVRTKMVDDDAMAVARIIPLEIIDGIDAEIAFRLQESNLYDVQNLAAANPIELFAETPYGLLEIFDWVLQAQLCANVGPKTFGDLKRHGIRTIFDLERAALSRGAPAAYVSALGTVLFRYADEGFRTEFLPSGEAAAASVDPDLVRHGVAVMTDDLHIHRLRSLWRTMVAATADVGESRWLYDIAPVPGELGPERDQREAAE
ncbi:MAG TPA: hypothetical protein VF603_12630 [Allosphingosinicella sp.]